LRVDRLPGIRTELEPGDGSPPGIVLVVLV
jgi:hypothetical protein